MIQCPLILADGPLAWGSVVGSITPSEAAVRSAAQGLVNIQRLSWKQSDFITGLLEDARLPEPVHSAMRWYKYHLNNRRGVWAKKYLAKLEIHKNRKILWVFLANSFHFLNLQPLGALIEMFHCFISYIIFQITHHHRWQVSSPPRTGSSRWGSWYCRVRSLWSPHHASATSSPGTIFMMTLSSKHIDKCASVSRVCDQGTKLLLSTGLMLIYWSHHLLTEVVSDGLGGLGVDQVLVAGVQGVRLELGHGGVAPRVGGHVVTGEVLKARRRDVLAEDLINVCLRVDLR